jgi:organic radical activating enzyme
MKHIKISELFYSIQGEGRYMGVPSVFLRTFGCNFTCSGFGMPKGQLSTERHTIDINNYKSYKELPLVSTGCDSYASWDNRFKHLSDVIDTKEISNQIMEILPKKKWVDEHLVITGGEPLLGWQKAYPHLLSDERMLTLKELTFETNGTQNLSKEFRHYLLDWTLRKSHGITAGLDNKRGWERLTFSVSAKLSNSGEKYKEAIKPDVVAEYEEVGYTYLKFVVATDEDCEEAEYAVNQYRKMGFKGPVYLMPVGGIESVYSMNNRKVAELAMKKGYRYSDRLQVPLFKNEWGT